MNTIRRIISIVVVLLILVSTAGQRTYAAEADKENTAALIRENGDEAPVVIRKLLPEVKGAAVVVDGNNSMELEKKISASVKSALGISVNKISIVINERNE